jgi:CheY-like chemotaxis protein
MVKLLLIEDDSDIAEIISAELAGFGFQVEWAADGIEGLDKARSLRPDAMIVDRLLYIVHFGRKITALAEQPTRCLPLAPAYSSRRRCGINCPIDRMASEKLQ